MIIVWTLIIVHPASQKKLCKYVIDPAHARSTGAMATTLRTDNPVGGTESTDWVVSAQHGGHGD